MTTAFKKVIVLKDDIQNFDTSDIKELHAIIYLTNKNNKIDR